MRTWTSEKTMLEFSVEQRVLLAETLRDIANIAAGALLFGQFLSDRPFSVPLGIMGAALWFCLVVFAIAVAGRKS